MSPHVHLILFQEQGRPWRGRDLSGKKWVPPGVTNGLAGAKQSCCRPAGLGGGHSLLRAPSRRPGPGHLHFHGPGVTWAAQHGDHPHPHVATRRPGRCRFSLRADTGKPCRPDSGTGSRTQTNFPGCRPPGGKPALCVGPALASSGSLLCPPWPLGAPLIKGRLPALLGWYCWPWPTSAHIPSSARGSASCPATGSDVAQQRANVGPCQPHRPLAFHSPVSRAPVIWEPHASPRSGAA